MSVESKWGLDLISLLERWANLKPEVKRSVIRLILPASPSAFDGSNLNKLRQEEQKKVVESSNYLTVWNISAGEGSPLGWTKLS